MSTNQQRKTSPSQAFDQEVDDNPRPAAKAKNLTATELIDVAVKLILDFVFLFVDSLGTPHAAFEREEGMEVVRIRDSQFASMVRKWVHENTQQRLSKAVLAEVMAEVETAATCGSTSTHEVSIRVAPGEMPQAAYIDLCDANRRVIEIDANGWRLAAREDLPAFVRPPGMTALPFPIGLKGDLNALRPYVNVRNDQDWRLLVVYLLSALQPHGPYPILLVTGTAGSSKSTFCRVLRALIDPANPASQSMPQNERDLVITASRSHVISIDNARTLAPSASDSLCRLATGGGFRIRQMYSDNAEVMFNVMRPCIINGIAGIADQPDLLSRAIHLELPMIHGDKRRTEAEFWSHFGSDHARIFAGLLDASSQALAVLPTINVAIDARMADFFRFGCAVEKALGWPSGSFRDAYATNQEAVQSDSLVDDPLAQAVIQYVSQMKPGEGGKDTPAVMLAVLAQYADLLIRKSSKSWPQTPHALGKRLRKLEPALRACGVVLKFGHSGAREIMIGRSLVKSA